MNRYEIAAELAGVPLCTREAGGPNFHLDCGRVLHNGRTNFTKRGLFVLLERAWFIRWGDATEDLEQWQRTYRRGRWINGIATDMHVVLPRSLFALMRAQLREQLAKAGSDIPARLRDTEYHEAIKWARR